MATFAFDPEKAKIWANSVVSYLNGENNSIYACSKKFDEQIEKIIDFKLWTGSAAAQNYQNFMDTHQALIDFTNSFGNAFEEAMNSVNKNIASLEISNLGSDTNVSSSFGEVMYNRISELSEMSVNKEKVKYVYDDIASIGSELSKIELTLEEVKENLKLKLEELNNGSEAWDGNAAERAQENLLNVVDTNMSVVSESLQICISNISASAEAVRLADKA